MNDKKIDKDIKKYATDIVRMSYENYKKEFSHFENISTKSFESLEEYIGSRLGQLEGIVYLENGKCAGYLLYAVWEEDGTLCCRIPEWGYGSDSEHKEKIICRLFQTVAEEIVKDKTVNFSVNLYAHDLEMQRLFSYMEFGIQAETGIRSLKKEAPSCDAAIRELSKTEIQDRWQEIWKLLKQLIDHLKESPVFYPGEEFTQEVYRDFFTDEGTRVFAAENGKEIIGLIEANADSIPLVFRDNEAANVGEAFVLPEYRGKNIAQALLSYAEQELLQAGYRYAWVEHGTANPNARYFWNKYFTTYKYEMIRKIN